MSRCILLAGTWDTKDDELSYLAEVIRGQGGRVLTMDVSVLGDPRRPAEVSKHQVAEAGGGSIAHAIAAGDENVAMQLMARGAAAIAARLHAEGRIDGALVLGGTMGTDLALDLCAALPLGVPKVVVSTVSFSPMIPPERLAPDIMMILWAGGLFGLNSVCKAALSQAAGAALGAARAVEPPRRGRPVIGMTSFGKTVLTYMVALKPALEARGFEVAVFHATGMGGRAFEGLAAEGAFAAVLDLAPQEVANHLFGSAISAGPSRLTAAGRRGLPQVVSVGCADLADFVGWQPPPTAFAGQNVHAHNRLLSSVVLAPDQRALLARTLAGRLAEARGETVLVLPEGGAHEWDRPGAPLHDLGAHRAFLDRLEAECLALAPAVRPVRTPAHINDAGFAECVLAVVDGWIARDLL